MIADNHDFALILEVDGNATVDTRLDLSDAPFGPRFRADEIASLEWNRHIAPFTALSA